MNADDYPITVKSVLNAEGNPKGVAEVLGGQTPLLGGRSNAGDAMLFPPTNLAADATLSQNQLPRGTQVGDVVDQQRQVNPKIPDNVEYIPRVDTGIGGEGGNVPEPVFEAEEPALQ